MPPTKILSHEECRKKVCLICLRKSDRPVKNSQIEDIKNCSKIFKTIQPWDERVPTGICWVCTKDLTKIVSSASNTELKFPKDFCYSKDVLILPNTRSNSGDEGCFCLICKIGRAKPIQPHPYYNVPFNKIFKTGRPVESKQEIFLFDNKISIQENLLKLKEAEPKKSEQFAQQVLKQKDASPGGTMYLSGMFGGRPMPVSIGKNKKTEKTVFSVDEMEDLAVKGKLSQRTIRLFSNFINKKPNCSVESGFQIELPLRNRLLEDFYDGDYVDFYTSDLENAQVMHNRPLVFCKNAQELIFHLCDIRDQAWQEFQIQIFLDSGKDSLKLSCVIIPTSFEDNQKAGRKLSGVN